MFEVSLFTVQLFTALQYRYNEDESVPGIVSDEKGFGVSLQTVTTGLVCVCVCVCVCVAPRTSIAPIVLDAIVEGG